jgi:hypothetical protein
MEVRRMAELKQTTFGDIGRRDIFVIRMRLLDEIEKIERLARKAKRIFENWEEVRVEDLEDLFWDICIAFSDCLDCPMEYFCVKRKGNGGDE